MNDISITGFSHLGRKGSSLTVWCPWCCVWHIHGYQGETPGTTTHRVAHCRADNSPYKKTGYCIRVTDAPWGPFLDIMKQANSRQQQIIADGRSTPGIEKLRSQSYPIG